MLREKERVIRQAMVISDAVILSLTFLAAFALRRYFQVIYTLDLFPSFRLKSLIDMSLSEYLVVYFFVIPIWCIMLYWNGMYQNLRTKSRLEIIWIIIKSAFLTILTFGAIAFLFKLKFVSRLFFAFFIIISSISLLIEKTIIFSLMHYALKQGYNLRRLLIVGTGERAANFIEKIKKHPEWGIVVEGVLDYEKNMVGKKISDIEVKGTLEGLQPILQDIPIDEVVFIIPRAKLSEIENSLYICEIQGVRATIAVDLFELKIAKSRQTELDGIPLITFETTVAAEWKLFIKRLLDLSASAFGIIILSPLFLAVAVLIKLTSPGPVLFLQKRVGLNGRKFVLCKFRTMYKDAHKRLSELERLNEMAGPVFKIKQDPRITPFGKILRKFSMDELPQLFNIFMGHMSLVGPRPLPTYEIARLKPWQKRRLSMRPGLTCLWQISGRNRVDFDEWIRLDLEYLDKWSLLLDFKILVKTVPVVLFGIGAY